MLYRGGGCYLPLTLKSKKQNNMKKTTVGKVKDNATFQLETRKRSATWTVITKRKGGVTVNSKGGSTRILKASTKCFIGK